MASVLNRNGSYFIMVSLGYDLNGKQIRKTKNWKPPAGMSPSAVKKELEKVKVEFEQAVLSGKILEGNINFRDFSERWLRDYGEMQLAPKTLDRYRRMLEDRIYPNIGNIRLDKLQPHNLMELYKQISKPGERRILNCTLNENALAAFKESNIRKVDLAKRTGCAETTIYQALKGGKVSYANAVKILKCLKMKAKDGVIFSDMDTTLSSKTVSHYHRLISVILKTAVYWQVIHSSPAERVKPPKSENKEAKYLDEKQTAHLIECLKDEPLDKRTMIVMFIYSGMRRGELLGLHWDDIDFENKMVSINKTLQYLPGKGIFTKKPKTRASVRTIKLSDEAFKALSKYRVAQAEQKEAVGDRWQETGFVFTGWNGVPMHPDTTSAWFSDFVKRHGLLLFLTLFCGKFTKIKCGFQF